MNLFNKTADAPVPVANAASTWTDQIHTGDCLALLPDLPTSSVDMVFADLPYGVTRSRWDTLIPLPQLWEQLTRVLKPNGAVAMTAAQPFTSVLVMSNPKWFKYEQIWVKTIGSGQLNITHQPLRVHESVLVFYNKRPTYNPQHTAGTPYRITRRASGFTNTYGNQRDHAVVNDGTRHPRSVLEIPNPREKGAHSAAKPIALVEHFIKTFTNPGEVVLDPTIGGGTTAIAATNVGRRFIGIEKDPETACAARNRLATYLNRGAA